MIITVDEIKQFLGITDDSHDTEITEILPTVELMVKQITRRQWTDTDLDLAYRPTVAKFAWWLIQQQNTNTPGGSVASESLGDISVSYSQSGANLDGRHGVPSWVVKGLPRYGGGF